MDAADWQPFAIYRDLSGSIAVKRIVLTVFLTVS